MNKLGLIIRREYINKVRNKSFVIMTFVSPIVMVLFALLIGYLTNVNNNSNAKKITVLDQSGLFSDAFKNTNTLTFDYLKDKPLKDAKTEVLSDNAYGLLYIPKKQLKIGNKKLNFSRKKVRACRSSNSCQPQLKNVCLKKI